MRPVDNKVIQSSILSANAMITTITILAVGGYLLASGIRYKIGFPLDDAWIHQTYARNLAYHHEFAFVSGHVSAGSTSPLWTFLLSIGYLLTSNPFPMAFALGTASLAGIAVLGERIFRTQVPSFSSKLPWMGLFLAGEWHLVWAAASGMETAFYALVILLIFLLLALETQHWLLLGILVGIAGWTRPDGISLLGPVLFCLYFAPLSWQKRFRKGSLVLIGFLVLMIPYLLMNKALSGNYWPNTFYAKQAEYAVYLQKPLVVRLLTLAGLPLIGGGVLLLPGFVYELVDVVKSKGYLRIAMFLWWAGYTAIYALRLPVDYQHGRYLMAAMPVYFLLGGVGTAALLVKPWTQRRWGFILSRTWLLGLVLGWFGFYDLGTATYATDVSIIESEMVKTAQWLQANTQPDDKIAVHDIGAIGYFSQREIVDLAGLVTPEVIPFIRDEGKLGQFLDQQHVQYLVTLEGWYPTLEHPADIIYKTGGKFSPGAGGTNMVVYRWKK